MGLMNMPNYYETLNVSRTASAVEILASYNILKKMFGADPEMSAELDTAVMVLKNDSKRAAYDRMMVEAMNKRAAKSVVPVELPPVPMEEELPLEETQEPVPMATLIAFDRRDRVAGEEARKDLMTKILAIACSLAVIGSIAAGLISNSDKLARLGVVSLEDIVPASFERPATAPNGQAFPEVSAYLAGYEVMENTGKSTLAIENRKGESDVYLKLLSHKDGKVGVARHIFVKAGSDFMAMNITPGKYEIQYQDMTIGKVGRSEVFEVTEGKSETGAETFDRLTVRLKTAVNGVLRVEKVEEKEFEKLASL